MNWTCNDMLANPADGWLLKDESTIELIGPTCTNFLSATTFAARGLPCDVFVPE